MTQELLQHVGLNWRFGYKTISKETGERCFFRFLDGKWHDVRAPLDFGYLAPQAIEILCNEMAGGNVLMVFACCCAECAKNPALKTALEQLTGSGVPADDVTHGYWPEHTDAETKRFEDGMARLMPVAEFRRLIGLAHNELEVRRLVLYHRDNLLGTAMEILEALDFASARAMHFDGPAEGIRPAKMEDGGLKMALAIAAIMILGAVVGRAGTLNLQPSTFNPQLFTALGQIESGNDDRAHGAAGEVSRFQILASEWRRTTSLPLSAATNPLTAWNVVCAIMDERARRILHTQLSNLTPRQFYLLWHRPARVGSPRPLELARAKRFENLTHKP